MPNGKKKVKQPIEDREVIAAPKKMKAAAVEAEIAGRKIKKAKKKYTWEKPGMARGEPPMGGSDLNDWRKDNLSTHDPSRSLFRFNVGARNPYAIAAILSARKGTALHWEPVSADTPLPLIDGKPPNEINRTTLEKALAVDGKVQEYNKLFDSANESIVFARALRNVMVAEGPSNTMINDAQAAAVMAQSSPCTAVGDHWGIYKTVPTDPASADAGVYTLAAKPTFVEILHDCVQGCANNCYLIAALCSLAWRFYPNYFPPAMNPTINTAAAEYAVTFHYSNNAGTRDVNVSKHIILSAGNIPVYSQITPQKEIWVALLERAYSAFRLFSTSGVKYDEILPVKYQDATTYPRPNIPDDQGGNPVETLVHLTGVPWVAYDPGAPSPNATYYQVSDLPNANEPGVRAFDKIHAHCTISGTQGRSNYPMVAYTYPTARDAINFPYDNEMIVANHSYAIFGTKIVDAAHRFIIIRNPYGVLHGAEPSPDANKWYLGAWNFPAAGGRPALNLTLSTNDGIFGIHESLFEQYFQGFGWVVV